MGSVILIFFLFVKTLYMMILLKELIYVFNNIVNV